MSPVPDTDVARQDARAAGTSGTASKDPRDAAYEAAAGARVDWFPTSIWRFSVAGHQALNEKLMRFIETERRQDVAGMSGRSSVMGWHSTEQLHRRAELQEFVAAVEDCVAEVARAYRLDADQASLELATCWAMVNGKMASGALHCHPNAFLSGVYYVNTTEKTGNIFFQDPRPGANMSACPVTEFTPWTVRQVSYQPVPGGMLIFPSWLYHGVGPNLSDTPRVSLSFNFRLKWVADA
jgi:uncharacterized protein (TIGR02466 family)